MKTVGIVGSARAGVLEAASSVVGVIEAFE